MEKRNSNFKKIIFWLSAALAFVFLFMATILGNVSDRKPMPTTYPKGNLSQDLFVSQNTQYIEQAAYPVEYAFKTSPYYINLPEGNAADIDKGHLVYGTDTITFFLSEVDEHEDPHDAVLEQYPAAVYLNYAKQASYCQTVVSEIGYINGYKVNYFIDHLLISTGAQVKTQSAYMIGYVVYVGDKSNTNLIIAVATTEESEVSMNLCKENLDALIYTLRYSEKLQSNQERAAQKAAESSGEALIDMTETESSAATTTVQENSSFVDIPVKLGRDYQNLSILLSWPNSYTGAQILFCKEDWTTLATPSVVGTTQATIEVGACKEGNYLIRCNHYKDSGEISVKLIDN